MALKQQITTITGATVEYHRVSAATIDYTNRKVYIIVQSYLDSNKRDEEKEHAANELKRKQIEDELNKLLAAYTSPEEDTPEEEARRVELGEQLNALEFTPDDVAPRHIFEEPYEIELPADTDFNLEVAYRWLRENIYTSSEDC